MFTMSGPSWLEPRWEVVNHLGEVQGQSLQRGPAERECQRLNDMAQGTETTYYYQRITK